MNDRPKSLRPASRTDRSGCAGVLLVALLLGLRPLAASPAGNEAALASRTPNPPAVVTPSNGTAAKLAQTAITNEITAQVCQLGLEPAYQNWIVTNLCATFLRLPALKATFDRAPHDVATVQTVALALSHDVNAALKIDSGSNPYELGEVLVSRKANCIGSAQVFYLTARAVGLPVVATDVGACRELIFGRLPEDRALGRGGGKDQQEKGNHQLAQTHWGDHPGGERSARPLCGYLPHFYCPGECGSLWWFI